MFKEVFAKDAKYMTVHQAKGLEWDTVIVGVNPTSRDKTDLIKVFSNPSIRDENPMDEFVRIYYVACGRARKLLYIHIPEDSKLISTIKENADLFKQKQRCNLDYSFIGVS